MTRTLVLLAICVASGCITYEQPIVRNDARPPDHYSVDRAGKRLPQYSRLTELVAPGEAGLGARERIAAAYERAQRVPPPDVSPVIFHAELPPGIALRDRAIEVAPRAPYGVIASYTIEYALATAPPETGILDDLRRLAAITTADAVFVTVDSAASGGRVHRVSGLLLGHRVVAPATATRATPTTARLRYRATAPGCPTDAELRASIATALGYAPWDDASTNALDIELVRRDDVVHATLRIADAAPRRLTGFGCRAVARALTSIVALHLEAHRAPS